MAQTQPAVHKSSSRFLYRVLGGDHGSGTTFWVRSLTLEQEYTSIGASDDFFDAIFELSRENCIDTRGAARSQKRSETLFTPRYKKCRRFLGKR